MFGIAWPGDVSFAVENRCSDRVDAGHEVPVAELVQNFLTHPGHDPHTCNHVGRVGELHSDRSER